MKASGRGQGKILSKSPSPEQADLFGFLSAPAPQVSIQEKPAASLPVEPAPPPPLASEEASLPRLYSVSELSGAIRQTLREGFSEILVQGEISDFKGVHRSGHLYFGLKDEKAQIRAVMWKAELGRVPFEPRGGLEVIVTGKIDYYAGGGSLQIVVTRMEPVGIGALQLKFEQLKEKLKNEGLFDSSRKRKVPSLNWRIGLVTGRSTAALQDMLKIFSMRFPLAEVFLFHASVQGPQAPMEITRAIEKANRFSRESVKPLDVLIIGRGGGSYEDLFCFNDEGLARAIVASSVPTVSAVGHEIDFTIADLVADKRAATPSHAAQEVVPELALWFQRLTELERVFRRDMTDLIYEIRQKTDILSSRLLAAAPQKRLEVQGQRLKDLQIRVQSLMSRALERRQQSIVRYGGLLDALSPLKVLDRGYAVAALSDGKILRSRSQVQVGSDIRVKLPDGVLTARVLDSSELG